MTMKQQFFSGKGSSFSDRILYIAIILSVTILMMQLFYFFIMLPIGKEYIYAKIDDVVDTVTDKIVLYSGHANITQYKSYLDTHLILSDEKAYELSIKDKEIKERNLSLFTNCLVFSVVLIILIGLICFVCVQQESETSLHNILRHTIILILFLFLLYWIFTSIIFQGYDASDTNVIITDIIYQYKTRKEQQQQTKKNL